MARTNYALGSPEGVERGPELIAEGTEVSAVEAAEQFGFGIVDVRLHYRNSDGSTIPKAPCTGWVTGLYTNASRIGMITIPKDELFAGLHVISQAGFGVVNFQLKKRKKADNSDTPDSAVIVPNMEQSGAGDCVVPRGAKGEGIYCKEQAGYGVVDMAIDYKEPG